jgi:hypothetical protein
MDQLSGPMTCNARERAGLHNVAAGEERELANIVTNCYFPVNRSLPPTACSSCSPSSFLSILSSSSESLTPWCSTDIAIDSTDEALFSAATRVTVRNGRTASFWTSSWINGASPAAMFPLLHKFSRRKNRTVRDALENDNWIRDLPSNLTVPLISDYVLLWELVEEAGFDPQNNDDDEIIWTRTADGTYSAKSAYDLQFEGNVPSVFPSCIWRIWAPSRCNFFLWLCFKIESGRQTDCSSANGQITIFAPSAAAALNGVPSVSGMPGNEANLDSYKSMVFCAETAGSSMAAWGCNAGLVCIIVKSDQVS